MAHTYGSVICDQKSEFIDLNENYNCKISLSQLDQKLTIKIASLTGLNQFVFSCQKLLKLESIMIFRKCAEMKVIFK